MRGAAFLLVLLAIQVAFPHLIVSGAPVVISPGLRLEVKIPETPVNLVFPNGTIYTIDLSSPPEFASWAGDVLILNTSSLPLGTYKITWTDGSYSFVLDRIDVELRKGGGGFVVSTFSELTGSPLSANVTVVTPEGDMYLTSVGSTEPFNLPTGNYTLKIVATSGNLTGELVEEVSVHEMSEVNPETQHGMIELEREVYFPGDVVVVRVTSIPPTQEELTVILPDNRTIALPLNHSGDAWTASLPLNSSVMLGLYRVSLGNSTADFYVDYYELNASYRDGFVRGTVSYYFVPPKEVRYRFSSGLEGAAEVVNGTFIISVPPDEREVELRCGSSQLSLPLMDRGVELEREVYFPGDMVVVRARFKPSSASLVDPEGRIVPLVFERSGDHWESTYPLNSSVLLGNYSVEVDGVEDHFVVDCYEFELTYEEDKGIVGRVEYQILPPPFLSYEVDGVGGNTSLDNGNFIIPVILSEGVHSVLLTAWGRTFSLSLTIKGSKSWPSAGPHRGEGFSVAYDPVSRRIVVRSPSPDKLVVKMLSMGIKALKKVVRRIGRLNISEYELPATSELLRRFGLPGEVLNTVITSRRVNETVIRLGVKGKLEINYRFSVKIPQGYRVGKIVGDDGRVIVNDIKVNRSTGEVEGEIRWYVDDGVLYFFDDPITGYDITLIPPGPNNSVAIEEVEAGQLSAIVFPYSQGDSSSTIASYDHAGRTEDNWANDIDADAGSKIAVRYTTDGGTRQYGNDGDFYWTGNYFLTEISRENVSANTVPNGMLESVIITEMQAQWSGYELNITQKTIIRDNKRWFATIYYLRNPTSNTYTNLRFFQGMDWNFNGDYYDDDSYYDSSNDVVYGYDSNAPPGDIEYGGFRAEQPSSLHEVGHYGTVWTDILYDRLTNSSSYEGDAGTALAWDRDSLAPGEVWVVPVIWGLGYDMNDMLDQINDGLSQLHDVGIKSIDTPENGSRVNPHVNSTIWINATAALYGIVDEEDVPIKMAVEKIGGGYSSTQTKYVSLYVPHNETAQVSFSLDVVSLSPGAYNITVSSELPGDQNTSNDAKSIVIYVTTFSVEPDQEEKVYPGSEAEYNVTAYNYDEEERFDVSIIQSTKGWATELYEGDTLIAEDSDGDGIWDFIAIGYDSNGNGLPDLLLPLGETNLTVRKIVPSTAPMGEVDLTELNFTKISDTAVYDTVSLYTDTIHPGNVEKQFYLHGDADHTLNTTVPTVSSSETTILSNSLDSWTQSPPFSGEFVISGDVTVTLYLRSYFYFYEDHDVVIDLLYTDGDSVTVIGSVEQMVTLNPSSSPYSFTMPLTNQVSIPKGSYLVLRIKNQAPYPLYIAHDSSHPSKVEVSTFTYIKVAQVETDSEDYSPGDTITVTANVTDPIGAYDISDVVINVFDQSDNLILTDNMGLISEDPGSPPFWRIYRYQFSLSDFGIYTVEVRAVETNGVTHPQNVTIYVSWPIQGRVYEDFGVLGALDSDDVGIPNVRILLYRDDGDGVFDFGDKIIDSEITDSSGRYVLHSVHNGKVYVVVDSSTIISVRGLNPGYTWDDVWAEETFHREWDGSSWTLVQSFGGKDPNMGDMENGQPEHYVEVDPSIYSGESLDFGFSYEVVVNTLDRMKNPVKAIGEVFKLQNVGSSWVPVFTHHFYESPVVVCTHNLPSSSDNEAVVRIKDVSHYSFKVRIQNPSGKPVTPRDVHCLVMEEGSWELDDGRKVEAHRVVSHGTNDNNNWDASLMEHVPYVWAYTSPVVLGQVMSYNDSRWSVFWDSNGDRTEPPDSSNLYVGKHVGEDPVTYRSDELLGVVIVEAGKGSTGGLGYEAQLGPDTVQGVGDSPPYVYSLSGTFTVGVVTQSAMDGTYGGWAVLFGDDPITNELHLAIDKDTLSDSERRHTTEQVAYWVFERPGSIYAKTNELKYAQGSLRQFIVNANAVKGYQRSYFVMMVDPNVAYAGSWRIEINHTLGQLPSFNDSAGASLNGTVFYPNMAVRNSNPGVVGSIGRVGTGPDGIPGTGDECTLGGVEKPELEIYGNGLDGSGIVINASNTWVSRISLYGFGSSYPGGALVLNGTGSMGNISLSQLLVGLTSNGDDPSTYGLARNGAEGIEVNSSGGPSFNVTSSLVAYNGYTGIHVEGGPFEGTIEGVEVFSNGLVNGLEDGVSVEEGAGGVILRCSYIHDNAAYGFDSWNGIGGNVIEEVNVSGNGVVADQGEDGGIRIFGNGTLLNASVIYENAGPGVVIANWSGGSEVSVNNSILVNSIFSNGEVGIDLDTTHPSQPVGDNVTVNDGILRPELPNQGVDYPIITDFSYDPVSDTLYVEGYVNREDLYEGSPTFSDAEVLVFLVNNTDGGDDLIGNDYSGDSQLAKLYGEGWIYLGKLETDPNGEFSGMLDLSSLPDWAEPDGSSALTALLYKNGIGSSEFGPAVKKKPVSVSIKKDIEPLSDCSLSVILTASNLNPWSTTIKVYDAVPDGMVLTSPSETPQGSSGGVYWWFLTLGPSGSPEGTRSITYTLTSLDCGSSDFQLSKALIVGVDPPGMPEVKIDEFLDVLFHYNGSYVVREHWGFLTLINPKGDEISDVRIPIHAPSYEFYPDYPVPSTIAEEPPLRAERVGPGEYVRWRFTAPKDVTPPITLEEELTPQTINCGGVREVELSIRLESTRDVDEVEVMKPVSWASSVIRAAATTGTVDLDGGVVRWRLGPLHSGDAATLSLTLAVEVVEDLHIPDARVRIRGSHPPLLDLIGEMRYVGPASINIVKERVDGGYSISASFSNRAGDLSYNLTSICVYEGEPESGRLVFCENPGAIIGPGSSWSSPAHLDSPASEFPSYYIVANFTGLSMLGGNLSFMTKVGGGFESAAILREPVIRCEGSVTTGRRPVNMTVTRAVPTPNITTEGPSGAPMTPGEGRGEERIQGTEIKATSPLNVSSELVANLSLSKTCSPTEVEVGDPVVCWITVTNTGNVTARELLIIDEPTEGLVPLLGRGIRGRRISWRIDKLSAGESRSFSFVFKASRVGSWANRAYLGNLTASSTIVVKPPEEEVHLQKVGIYSGRGLVEYILRIRGPRGSTAVDELPEGMEIEEVLSHERVDISIEGREVRISARDGAAVVFIVARYPRWIFGGTLTNRARIPGGPESSATLELRGLMRESVLGMISMPMSLLILLFIIFRRRKAMLIDYSALRDLIDRGDLPSFGLVISEATASKALSDPAVSSMVEKLISSGSLHVRVLDEDLVMRSLEVAKNSGLDLWEAAELLLLGGARPPQERR